MKEKEDFIRSVNRCRRGQFRKKKEYTGQAERSCSRKASVSGDDPPAGSLL